MITPVKRRGRTVSSSEIRRAVEAGKVALAGRLLGRPYATAGEVVPGHGIGSKQTVPTLNLRTARAGDSRHRRLHHANLRRRIGAPLEFDHQHRLPPDVRRSGDPELTIETFLLDPLDGPTPSAFAWSFCAACAMSASSKPPRP